MTDKKDTKQAKPVEILVDNENLEDVQPETITGADLGKIQAFEKMVESLKQENAEMKDKMLREVAEAQNFQKRLQREKIDIQKYAVTKMARELLNILDNLGRAQDSVPKEQREESELIKNLMIGVEATKKELLRIFDQFKIKPFNNMGEKFDPNIHRVMFEQEDPDKEPGTILQVVQDGYMIEDRLLREALVGVSKKPSSASNTKEIDKKI